MQVMRQIVRGCLLLSCIEISVFALSMSVSTRQVTELRTKIETYIWQKKYNMPVSYNPQKLLEDATRAKCLSSYVEKLLNVQIDPNFIITGDTKKATVLGLAAAVWFVPKSVKTLLKYKADTTIPLVYLKCGREKASEVKKQEYKAMYFLSLF